MNWSGPVRLNDQAMSSATIWGCRRSANEWQHSVVRVLKTVVLFEFSRLDGQTGWQRFNLIPRGSKWILVSRGSMLEMKVCWWSG